jgi:excinuclease ABC subunit C
MSKAAESMDFEGAQNFKEKLEIIQRYQSKSTIVSSTIKNLDVFGYEEDVKKAYINFLKVIDGAIIQSHTIELKKQLEETPEDLLSAGIVELRERFDSNSREVVVPFLVDIEGISFDMKVPQRGDRKNLLDLSLRNLKYYLLDKKKRNESIKKNKEESGIAKIMQQDLNLKEAVHRIECFDNSNFQGTDPVAACVVFENGKPKNADYRHYKVKTVKGPDDFASMREIVYRRYKRQVDEGKALPQLIVIDGGKGQLSAAVSALKEVGIYGKVAIIGIAKRLEEIFFPGDSIPIYLDKTSTTLKVIQHCRNEAHRFGITFHRDLRSKNTFKTSLQDIDGIGYQTAQKLLRKFKSVKKIEEASLEELKAEIGQAKAEVVWTRFH